MVMNSYRTSYVFMKNISYMNNYHQRSARYTLIIEFHVKNRMTCTDGVDCGGVDLIMSPL